MRASGDGLGSTGTSTLNAIGTGTSTETSSRRISDTAELAQLRERRAALDTTGAFRATATVPGELIRVVYEQAKRSIWANFAALLAFLAIISSSVSAIALGAWTALVAVLLLVRYLYVSRVMRSATFPEPARQLERAYTFGATLTGLAFGFGFVLFVEDLSAHQRVLMLLTISGMAAGAALSMAASRLAYYGYMAGAMLPPLAIVIMTALRHGDLVSYAELYVFAAYMGVMVVIHGGAGMFVRNSVSLQLENDKFVAALERHSASLSRDRDAFRAASLTDALTKVANRRSFDTTLEEFWAASKRSGEALGCLMLDVDSFKLYNDRHGHDAGDRCLAKIAAAMAQVARRNGDYLARYGGEEFVVLLRDTSPAGTLYIGESVRAAVEELGLPHMDSRHGVVTVSVGATAVVPGTGVDRDGFIKLADDALYAAKTSGRNRVHLVREGGTLTADSGPEFPGRVFN